MAYHEHIVELCAVRTVQDVGKVPAAPQELAGDELVTGCGVGQQVPLGIILHTRTQVEEHFGSKTGLT